MTIYRLHTNEGIRYRRTRPSHEEMFAYIKRKRAEGMSLAAIVFCWTTISVGR